MGPVIKTVGRVAAGVFTLGLSELAGSMGQKSTPGVAAPAATKVDENKAEQQEKEAERRRRQIIARQNRTVQTSPLGASVNQGLLGGPTLTGQ